jgi:hypothetical protein
MKNVLLSFIGSHDHEHNMEGPILSIIKEINKYTTLNEIIIFYTKGEKMPYIYRESREFLSVDTIIEKFKNMITSIHQEDISIICHPIEFEEGENISITNSVIRHLVLWLSKYDDQENNYLLNATSGAPSVRMAFEYISNARLLHNSMQWYAANPMYDQSSERTRIINNDIWEESIRIHNAAILMKEMSFFACANALYIQLDIIDTLITKKRYNRIAIWRNIATAYDLWDQSDYFRALDILKSIHKMEEFPNLPTSIRSTLQLQQNHLSEICGVITNAKRRYMRTNRGKSPDDTDKYFLSLIAPFYLPILLDLFASLSRRHKTKSFSNIATRTRRIIDGCIAYLAGKHITQNSTFKGKVSTYLKCSHGAGQLLNNIFELYNNDINHNLLIPTTTVFNINTKDFILDSSIFEKIESLISLDKANLNRSIETHGIFIPDQAKSEYYIDLSAKILLICMGYEKDTPLIITNEKLSFSANVIVKVAEEFKLWV